MLTQSIFIKTKNKNLKNSKAKKEIFKNKEN